MVAIDGRSPLTLTIGDDSPEQGAFFLVSALGSTGTAHPLFRSACQPLNAAVGPSDIAFELVRSMATVNR